MEVAEERPPLAITFREAETFEVGRIENAQAQIAADIQRTPDGRPAFDFDLQADQFFVLGDNSAASKDSRLWLEGHHVDRELLIGKAMAIFWPHAVPASWSVPVKIGGAELRLPSWPNFGRMGFVR